MSHKVNLSELIKDMIREVKEIDSDNSLSRSEKTKKVTRVAAKFKSRLHDDKRKAERSKISLSTYRKYMTQARAAITEQNWPHHSLDQQIERLCKKHPNHAEGIQALGSYENVTELRFAHRDLLKALKKDDAAYDDVKSMKLDHEIMRHLTMPAAQKAQLADDYIERLEDETNNTVDVDYFTIERGIRSLLTEKTKVVQGESFFSYGRLALGIALSLGRRAIEVLKSGRFEKIDNHKVKFSGQAKKRGGVDYDETYDIYSVVDVDLVLVAIKELKRLPEIKALDEFDSLSEVKRNDAINKRCAKTLNTTAKQFFKDEERVFKDSRAIWARIVFDRYFTTDKAWAKKTEDVFWREMLGHDDLETQKSYKKFKIDYSQQPEEVETNNDNTTRLGALTALDDHELIKNRAAVLKIHNWVKSQIERDNKAKISQSLITREVGSGRKVIQDYLALAGDALAVVDSISKPKKAVNKRQNKSKSEAKTKPAKPILKSNRIDDRHWHAQVFVNGEEVAAITVEGSQNDALKAVWAIFQLI